MRHGGFIIFAFLIFISCSRADTFHDEPYRIRIPQDFPPITFPEGNEPTLLRVRLGRQLFYDKRLSVDNTVNCATCHVPAAAFTDGRVTSQGISKIAERRNAPTLANMAWSPYFMMEGGVRTLELQSMAPLHDSLEMGMDMMIAIDKLNQDKTLRDLAKAAYGRDSIDPFVVTRALACFERTFVSGDSRFDRHQLGVKDQLNPLEMEGMNLFLSEKTNCSSCHQGELFTDFGFYNVGLYSEYADPGKERESYKPEDIGKFKTPTLRNIALTAPYMHDGSLGTLDEVVDFYNRGGQGHPNQDPRVRPLHLTTSEKSALIAFLHTLTDYNFVQNPQYLPLIEE